MPTTIEEVDHTHSNTLRPVDRKISDKREEKKRANQTQSKANKTNTKHSLTIFGSDASTYVLLSSEHG